MKTREEMLELLASTRRASKDYAAAVHEAGHIAVALSYPCVGLDRLVMRASESGTLGRCSVNPSQPLLEEFAWEFALFYSAGTAAEYALLGAPVLDHDKDFMHVVKLCRGNWAVSTLQARRWLASVDLHAIVAVVLAFADEWKKRGRPKVVYAEEIRRALACLR